MLGSAKAMQRTWRRSELHCSTVCPSCTVHCGPRRRIIICQPFLYCRWLLKSMLLGRDDIRHSLQLSTPKATSQRCQKKSVGEHALQSPNLRIEFCDLKEACEITPDIPTAFADCERHVAAFQLRQQICHIKEEALGLTYRISDYGQSPKACPCRERSELRYRHNSVSAQV